MEAILKNEVPGELAESAGRLSFRRRTARLLSQVIFLSLLALIVLTAVPYGTVEPWWVAVFECITFVLGVIGIIESLLSGELHISEPQLLLPIILLVVFALIQTLPLWGTDLHMLSTGGVAYYTLSADPYESWLFALKLFAIALTGILLFRYTASRQRLLAVICVIVGIALLSAAFGIARQTMQREPGFMLPYLLPGQGYAQFINKNHFAYLMEMALGLMLGLMTRRPIRIERLLIYLALALPIWVALVLSNSRAGLFSMLCQLFFVALLFSFVRLPGAQVKSKGRAPHKIWHKGGLVFARALIIIGLMITVVVTLIWVGGEDMVGRLETIEKDFGADGDVMRQGASRSEIWGVTWRIFKANPIAGTGFGGYWIAVHRYNDASGEVVPQEAHNDYLELMASGGLIGTTLAVWFLFILAKRARARLTVTDSFGRASCFGAITGLLGVLVHSFFEFGLHVTINALIFTALVVVATVNQSSEGTGALTPKQPYLQ